MAFSLQMVLQFRKVLGAFDVIGNPPSFFRHVFNGCANGAEVSHHNFPSTGSNKVQHDTKMYGLMNLCIGSSD